MDNIACRFSNDKFIKTEYDFNTGEGNVTVENNGETVQYDLAGGGGDTPEFSYLLVTFTDASARFTRCDKTNGEMYDCVANNGVLVAKYNDTYYPMLTYKSSNDFISRIYTGNQPTGPTNYNGFTREDYPLFEISVFS